MNNINTFQPFHEEYKHPFVHANSQMAQAMSAWAVKTRRAPSRHCRNARVYDCKTTAMHEMTTPPPPEAPPEPFPTTRPPFHDKEARINLFGVC